MSSLSIQSRRLDWSIIIPAALLSIIGIVAIYSTCVAKGDFDNVYKQIIFFVVGLALMFLVSLFDYRILRNNSYLILILYGVCLLLLAGLQFFAPVIKGTKGWYKIGFLSLDPIEPAKLVVIILLAKYFSMRHAEMYKFRHIILSGVYVLLPALLVFIKPDLGGTALLLIIWLGILLISGIKIKHFLIILLVFLIVATIGWSFVLKDYQKERITAFLFPYDYFGASWSQNQSKIAIGSGMLFGKGLTNGSQVQFGFLPEPHTDFIFSVIAEEWGMLGVTALFLLYGFLVWNILRIAFASNSNFPRLFASGYAILLIAQFFINVGMNVSLLPVVGIYLPFISYGGSGLLGNFVALGILQSIATKKS